MKREFFLGNKYEFYSKEMEFVISVRYNISRVTQFSETTDAICQVLLRNFKNDTSNKYI